MSNELFQHYSLYLPPVLQRSKTYCLLTARYTVAVAAVVTAVVVVSLKVSVGITKFRLGSACITSDIPRPLLTSVESCRIRTNFAFPSVCVLAPVRPPGQRGKVGEERRFFRKKKSSGEKCESVEKIK